MKYTALRILRASHLFGAYPGIVRAPVPVPVLSDETEVTPCRSWVADAFEPGCWFELCQWSLSLLVMDPPFRPRNIGCQV